MAKKGCAPSLSKGAGPNMGSLTKGKAKGKLSVASPTMVKGK